MLHSAFHDLLKPQWLRTIAELKISGGLAVGELSGRFDSSYMTVKQHCEDLTKLGYLKRTRVPRKEIGRPEISYSLSEKANSLFPPLPAQFTLDMLDQVQKMFGETAPDKLVFQYFQDQEVNWKAMLVATPELSAKAQLFVKIRAEEGGLLRFLNDPETGGPLLREFHNPLFELFAKIPRAVVMEQRAMESALGVKITRKPVLDGSGQTLHTDFILHG